VQVAERWIIAALRHQKFFRLADLNKAIRELLERLNQRPFKKREGSRASVFAAVERNALRPLPAEPFDMSQWSYARVNIDYHIACDANFYSVPYALVQERVEVRATSTTIEIFHKGLRVASHVRGHGREQVFTQGEHRPKSHQAHLEWTPSRMVNWAEQIGPNTAKLFAQILAEKPHPEMGYRSCLGIIRLAEEYSSTRMEAAADRAIRTGACRFQSVKSILKNSLDQQPLPEPPPLLLPPSHDNIRGAEYFE
jgi:transposase